VAILAASATLRQSMSQKRAETVVVNETQSLTKVSGVEPVTSSHCAREVPPAKTFHQENQSPETVITITRHGFGTESSIKSNKMMNDDIN
jgi:hypothetical protein